LPDASPSFYIVGLGGSAGGLKAFEKFFTNLPSVTGMGFVLLQHLDPSQKCLLPELIQRSTKMKVFQIEDGMKVQPDCVYVIPPNRDLSIRHGVLQLIELSVPRGLHMPIDLFFRDLAEDQGRKSVGIIFSGMGSDGTMGLKAIKEKLGMVMAQDPETADFDSMPSSAVSTGLVDYIALAEVLPAKLIKYVKHVGKNANEDIPINKINSNAVQKILTLLTNQTGHDFCL
jgi:chemotaxis response regulator CheB